MVNLLFQVELPFFDHVYRNPRHVKQLFTLSIMYAFMFIQYTKSLDSSPCLFYAHTFAL